MDQSTNERTLRGHFGYEVIDEPAKVYIPYIYRNNDKWSPTSIHIWHFVQFMKGTYIELRPYLHDFGFLKGYKMNTEEENLMEEINLIHNDRKYPYQFKTKKQPNNLINIQDVLNIFQYVRDCTEKSKLGTQYQMKGNMAKIEILSSESELLITKSYVLPYVTTENNRYVPSHVLFDKNILPKKLPVTILKNMDAMYLRFLLDVLEHEIPMSSFKIPCLNLTELLEYLKESETIHDIDYNYWPTNDSNTTVNNNNLHFANVTDKNTMKTEEPKENPLKRKGSDSGNMAKQPRNDLESNVKVQTSETIEKPIKDNSKEVDKTHVKKEASKNNSSQSTTSSDSSEEYEVEDLLEYRKRWGKEEVLVHWTGYSSDYDSWEPLSHLNPILKDDVPELRKKWEEKQRQRRKH
ncbi:uncharacterized protein LOC116342113 [Contarinia nasturtii]|uniref:uncharacterized protein LOC116342113 n=1 Tax=Contarinia nasturtii TaxID=265458 RepID=UPI0012D3BFA7|nr:uncharacterized protein LOC116342113 [Contarinia nasturtii]